MEREPVPGCDCSLCESLREEVRQKAWEHFRDVFPVYVAIAVGLGVFWYWVFQFTKEALCSAFPPC